jgi:flagellar protein FliJ
MSALKSIQLAIELATRQRDQLLRVVGQVQQGLIHAQAQLDQLQGYSDDTDARWSTGAGHAVSVELMQHHYQFMDRLQQAITMQTGVIAQAQNDLERARKAALDAEFRLSGLQQVLRQRELALQKIQLKREQRQSDEFAAMLYARTQLTPISGESA